MKKIVYTVLLGNYRLREPKYINENWSLVCFTDRNINSENWNIIKIDHNNPLKKSREIKIRCDKFLDFDICLYLDARFTIRCNLDEFVSKNLKNDILVMKHRRRDCAYREANYCVSIGKGYEKNISRQTEQYQKDGFPHNFGLYACGIMVRKNTPEIIDFMKLWYNEIHKYSYRDQISFPYVLWKTPIKVDTIGFKHTCDMFK